MVAAPDDLAPLRELRRILASTVVTNPDPRAGWLRVLAGNVTPAQAAQIEKRVVDVEGPWWRLLWARVPAGAAAEFLATLRAKSAGHASLPQREVRGRLEVARGTASRGTEHRGTAERPPSQQLFPRPPGSAGEVKAPVIEPVTSGIVKPIKLVPPLRILEPKPKPLKVATVHVSILDVGGNIRGHKETIGKLVAQLPLAYDAWVGAYNRDGGVQFRFTASYGKEPSKDQKKKFGPLDFPVYLLPKYEGLEKVLDLMLEHEIPLKTGAFRHYEIVKKVWSRTNDMGLGIAAQPDRRVGFVMFDLLDKHGGEEWLRLLNVIGHETIHMADVREHSGSGLLSSPVEVDFGGRVLDLEPSFAERFIFQLLAIVQAGDRK
jgi:hypothetical protein